MSHTRVTSAVTLRSKLSRMHTSSSQVRLARGLSAWLLVSLAAALCATACKHDEGESADSTEALGSASPNGGHPKRELPPAAFDACQGKNASDACTVQFGTHQINSQCAAAPDGRLACIPHHGQHKKPEGS